MSNSSSIAFINQYLLDHPSLRPVLADINPDLTRLINGMNDFGYMSSFYNRIGKDTMFCKNPGSVDFMRFLIDYSPISDLTFEQASDRRCMELRKSHWSKPWVILWSGGIDSTVIIASVLRNLPSSDFSNIKICCSSGSIYENPRFFVDHVCPNFEVINNPDMSTVYSKVDDVFIIHGLPGHRTIPEIWSPKLRKHGVGELLWQNNRDRLVSLLSDDSPVSVDYCNWIYNAMADNILSTGLPIVTISEWCWWFGFNHMWGTINLSNYIRSVPRALSNSTTLNNTINWFNCSDYQKWEIQNFKNPDHLTTKLDFKQYIHTMAKDEYYLKFKRKIKSNHLTPCNRFISDNPKTPEQYAYLASHHYFCILENLEFLYLDTDFDQIAELLPAHFNLDSLQYLE